MRLPAALLIALFAVPVHAATSTPAPGIVHRSETNDGQRWHAVTVELGKPGISIHVSREEAKGRTLSQIAKAEGATVAINGSIFRAEYALCGVAVSRGVKWKAVDASSCIHGLGWGREPSSFRLLSTKGPFDAGASPFEGLTDVISGYPTLVRGGVACDGQKPDVCEIPKAAPAAFAGPNPRTMIGVDKDRKKLFLVVADGREVGAAAGLSLTQASVFLRDTIGVWDGVNLDGGGSSELWIGPEGGVQNVPSDGSERPIASAVVVRFDATNAPSAPTALPVDPPTFDERSRGNRARGAAAAPLFLAMAIGGGLMWLWSKRRR